MAFKLNVVGLNKKIEKSLESASSIRKATILIKEKSELAGEKIVTQLQSEFDAHPATLELSQGSQANHRFFSRGNLASYFGLSESKIGEDLANIRGLLTVFKVKIDRDGLKYRIKIIFPPVGEFYSKTPAPSQAYGKSWLQSMEEGLVQNFGRFFFKRRGLEPYSRSGTGIQISNVISGGVSTVPKIPYIKSIYNKVLKDIDIGKALIGKALSKIK